MRCGSNVESNLGCWLSGGIWAYGIRDLWFPSCRACGGNCWRSKECLETAGESHLTRRLFGSILWRIAGQPVPAGQLRLWQQRNPSREMPRMERCLREPMGHVAVSGIGTRVGADSIQSRSRPAGPAKEETVRWNPLMGGYTVRRLGAKTEIPVRSNKRRQP